jgi:hypothetical protein
MSSPFLPQQPQQFKVYCINPCSNVLDGKDEDEVNFVDMMYNVDAVLGAVPSAQYRIAPNAYTKVIFNTLIDQYGAAVSPNLTTGEFTINETGLYNVSYEISWNNILYNSTGGATGRNTGIKFASIVVDSPITSTSQIYGITNSSSTSVIPAVPANTTFNQGGGATILLNQGDIVYLVVRLADNYSNLLSQVSGLPSSAVVCSTRIQINKTG